MKKIILASTIGLAFFGAQAQGFYIGVGAGYNSVDNNLSRLNTNLVTALGGTVTSSSDSSVNNLRLLAGYSYNENVALELGYINTQKYDLRFTGVTGNNTNYSGTGSVKFNGFDLSAVLRPAKSTGYNNFFGTIGVHNYKAKVSTSVTVGGNTVSSTESESGTGMLVGVGYDYNIQKDIDVRFGITRINNLAGESSTDITNYSIGLIKRF